MQRNTSLRYPGGRRALWGSVAYVAGYGISVLFVSSYFSQIRSDVAVRVGSSTYPLSKLLQDVHVPVWKWAGFAFYNAHFSDTMFRGIPGQFRTAATPVNLLTEAGGLFLILYLVPPLLLGASGLLVTQEATETIDLRFDLGATGPTRFAFNGGLITLLGYLPLTIVGGVLLVADLAGNAGAQADLLTSWVLVGMVYPFVFGGLGGYLRYRFC